jgi:predicted MFS family arabinose efflux permease
MIRENLICVIGCTVAATAKTVGGVICGTTILALGCGPQLQATACIAKFVPKKLRPVVTGVVAFSLFVSSVFGTPIGRDSPSWYLVVPLLLILTQLILFSDIPLGDRDSGSLSL